MLQTDRGIQARKVPVFGFSCINVPQHIHDDAQLSDRMSYGFTARRADNSHSGWMVGNPEVTVCQVLKFRVLVTRAQFLEAPAKQLWRLQFDEYPTIHRGGSEAADHTFPSG